MGWNFMPHASPRLSHLQFISSNAQSAQEPIKFLWLGRLSTPKRPEIFIKALAAVSARSAADVQGLIVGDGPAYRTLERMARRLRAPVEFAGHTEDVGPSIETCRALILTSDFEAVNFAVQEAAWVGRPVVVSPLKSLVWLLGTAGLYVRDAGSVERMLCRLLDAQYADDMGTAAALQIRKMMNPEDPWPRLEAIYGHYVPQT